jgi:hypothetical protein
LFVLGISAFYGDSVAALMTDGRIVAAAQVGSAAEIAAMAMARCAFGCCDEDLTTPRSKRLRRSQQLQRLGAVPNQPRLDREIDELTVDLRRLRERNR